MTESGQGEAGLSKVCSGIKILCFLGIHQFTLIQPADDDPTDFASALRIVGVGDAFGWSVGIMLEASGVFDDREFVIDHQVTETAA